MTFSKRTGLFLILGAILVPIVLSGLGFVNQVVWGAAMVGLFPFLFGAVAWIYPTRQSRQWRALHRQRNVLLVCLSVLLSIPLTRWPLELTFFLSRSRLENLRTIAESCAPDLPRTVCCPTPEMMAQAPDPAMIALRESRNRFPMGWLVRYPSRHWLVREVRLWHGEKEYEIFEFPATRWCGSAWRWHGRQLLVCGGLTSRGRENLICQYSML